MQRIIQSGRSMVEMLGVLAIIGVLSVGGLAGYSMAMEKIKTNRLRDQMMRIMTGSNSLFGGDLSKHFTTAEAGGHAKIAKILLDSKIISDDEYLSATTIKSAYNDSNIDIYVDYHSGYAPNTSQGYYHIEFVFRKISAAACLDIVSRPVWSGYHYDFGMSRAGSLIGDDMTRGQKCNQYKNGSGDITELYYGLFLN